MSLREAKVISNVRQVEHRPPIGDNLTVGLLRDSLLNLSGHALPMLVAVVAMPFTMRLLGLERFALLSLSWSLLGYFAFFDLGIGRATTNAVAHAVNPSAGRSAHVIIVTASAADLLVGAALSLALLPIVPAIPLVLDVPAGLRAEAQAMFTVLVMAVPVMTIGGTFRSALEGIRRFAYVNVVKGTSNALLFVLPIAGALAGFGLPAIVVLLILSRVAAAVLYGAALVRLFPGLMRARASSGEFRRLMKYGGWVTLTNFLTPIVTFGERLLIPAILTMGVLSFYVPPFEMVSRVAVIPASIAMTLFPRVSGCAGISGEYLWRNLVIDPAIFLFGVLTPLTGLFLGYAPEILDLWMGTEFREIATPVLQLLAVAFYFNGFAYLALAAVHGLGKPDFKAKLDMVQAVAFVVLCWFCISSFGIVGAAVAKLLIFVMDACMLFLFVFILARPSSSAESLRLMAKLFVLGLCFLGVSFGMASLPSPGGLKALYLLGALAAFGIGYVRLIGPARVSQITAAWNVFFSRLRVRGLR